MLQFATSKTKTKYNNMQVSVKNIDPASLPVVGWSLPRKVARRVVLTVGLFDWGVAQGWAPPGQDLRGLLYNEGHVVRCFNGSWPVFVNPGSLRSLSERFAAMPASLSLRKANEIVAELYEEAAADSVRRRVAAKHMAAIENSKG